MKIKVGQLRQIIREVAEDAAAEAAAEDTAALSAAIDDLASTWNKWSARVTSPTGFSKYGDDASNIDAVRILRKDQGTEKWGADAHDAAEGNAAAAQWVADADALPWPSSDIEVKVAILKHWVKGSSSKWDGKFLESKGVAMPTPGVNVQPSIADIQIAGGEWMRLVLGVPGNKVAGAMYRLSSYASDAFTAERKAANRKRR